MRRIAAIDYGKRRIGIALSDKNRKIALPLAMVEGGKKAVQNIRNSLPVKEVDLILLGLPLEMSGKKGEMSKIVEEFAKILQNALNISVQLIDERLTSKEADRKLKELPLTGKNRTDKLDMVAACILLQTYLDQSA